MHLRLDVTAAILLFRTRYIIPTGKILDRLITRLVNHISIFTLFFIPSSSKDYIKYI